MPEEFQIAYKKQFVIEGNYEEFMESLNQVKKTEVKLDISLTVLAAGKKDHYSAGAQKLWNTLQHEMLTISSDSRFIMAENSGHYIHRDEPEVVVAAVREVIQRSTEEKK
ncbi:hypothetical protein JSY36_05730 [Bacillus sp. H-16]|uniref:hypothetical protein n=1 Tax=Alteribacter salitolerans TaxID=2912333 RepID=UPI0019644C97|nr:hypothetical protein [Alteribacter salitolerans]MBM7095250.1 hypothetical protein [Alteribacter salitolerans]